MADFTITQGTNLPALRATLFDGYGNIMDLSGVSTVKVFTSKNGVPYIDGDSCTISDPLNGEIAYILTDTSIPGLYQLQFELAITSIFGSGTLRIPSDGYYYLDIIPKA